MSFSIYVHIPYCLQRCRYCDFTTFEQGTVAPPEKYLAALRSEIQLRSPRIGPRELTSIFFGGGTPSLMPAEMILAVLSELANAGFTWTPQCEITLEINPATVDRTKLERLVKGGVNRMSVGAQTFNDDLLKLCGRRHSAQDTRQTLRLLQEFSVPYSFDLLFALPGQTLDQLEKDLDEVAAFDPPHLSAYCLTVPEGHPMSLGRAPEDEQIQMFARIESRLKDLGTLKYEISNFAKPGFESIHNLGYWHDREFWGLGVSAHSYLHDSRFGVRFWNTKDLERYLQAAFITPAPLTPAPEAFLPSDQIERLKEHEALTDTCHMYLRTSRGLPDSALQQKFSSAARAAALPRLQRLVDDGLLAGENGRWHLTTQGQLMANHAFRELTFLPEDLTPFPRKSPLHRAQSFS